MEHNPFGENTEYPRKYDPDILYPIPRWRARSELNIDKKIRCMESTLGMPMKSHG
ncbi:MAG: hypothetical protein Ct9H300mP22_3220 [Gammaproteobacteria bacterium]|nr:MAG: hypothetical protein Ct9H300mP22_3220 [Gammaproteobacteria bacterium]